MSLTSLILWEPGMCGQRGGEALSARGKVLAAWALGMQGTRQPPQPPTALRPPTRVMSRRCPFRGVVTGSRPSVWSCGVGDSAAT